MNLTKAKIAFKLKEMRNLSFRRSDSQGQALLIILLLVAVGLTIGLAVVSRSITDIRISEQTEEAARAYSAAEAGIESALYSGTNDFGVFEGASYTATVSGVAEGATTFVFPQEVTTGEIATLFLVRHDANGNLIETAYYTNSNLDVCWQGDTALEVGIYYKDGTNYKVARGAYDPNSARRSQNFFSATDSSGCAGLTNKKTLKFTDDFGLSAGRVLLFLRLRVLYGNSKVGVSTPGGAGGILPSQGNKIESIGQAGEATRKVEVVRFHPAPPEIFDFVLYSGGALTK